MVYKNIEVARICCACGGRVGLGVRKWHEADNSGTRWKNIGIGDDGMGMEAWYGALTIIHPIIRYSGARNVDVREHPR